MTVSEQEWDDGDWIKVTISEDTGSMIISVNKNEGAQTIYLRKRDLDFVFNRLCEMGYKDKCAE